MSSGGWGGTQSPIGGTSYGVRRPPPMPGLDEDAAAPSPVDDEQDPEFDLAALRKQYLDFESTKSEEIAEQILSRHYYHADQWSATDIGKFKLRNQPVLTTNRIARKIDGVAGICERLRMDPKAYPRTPNHDAGASLATASIRYVLDAEEWNTKSAEDVRQAAINAIGGMELFIKAGQGGKPGDYDIGFDLVESETFFYDPRSVRLDFSDVRFMGVAKWLDSDVAAEMFPEHADTIRDMMTSGPGGLNWQQHDREKMWVNTDLKRVFLIEHWYLRAGCWYYCFYVDMTELKRGKSMFYGGDGNTICRYVMWSANVDHDGDRYGFVRNLKSMQDEINARRSKALHILNTRRIVMTEGAVQDIEVVRKEAARPDGIVVINPGEAHKFDFDDARTLADMQGQLEFLGEAKQEIENFGPNPAISGEGIENRSGRAIALTQAAGMAELGPFMTSWRGWKIRFYRAIWANAQRYWTGERWIRITDDDDMIQFISLNKLTVDEWGTPSIENAIGTIDVDIIIEEGPDTLTMQQDTYDTMIALAQKGAEVPPEVILELAPIDSQTKKKLFQRIEQAQQAQAQADPAQQQMAAAQIGKTKADAFKSFAAGAKDLAGIALEQNAQAQDADKAVLDSMHRDDDRAGSAREAEANRTSKAQEGNANRVDKVAEGRAGRQAKATEADAARSASREAQIRDRQASLIEKALPGAEQGAGGGLDVEALMAAAGGLGGAGPASGSAPGGAPSPPRPSTPSGVPSRFDQLQ
jgi:hypothetical protein